MEILLVAIQYNDEKEIIDYNIVFFGKKRLISLKGILKNISTIRHSQFKYHTLLVTPYKKK